jgi:subtilisin family serine protease
MKKFKNIALAGLLALTAAGISLAADDGYIIRTDPSVIQSIAKQYGLTIKRELGRGSGTYLVGVPDNGTVQNLRMNPLVQGVQSNTKLGLPEGVVSQGPVQSNLKKDHQPLLAKPGVVSYLTQDAINQMNLRPAQAQYGMGAGQEVAVIDTWIDTKHPFLAGSIDTALAYNAHTGTTGVTAMQETSPFIDQETSPFIDQETSPFIDQETSPFIDSTGRTVILNQETSPFIDQETSPFIDQRILKSPYVGHGTMIAGLVHLVAPSARILPIVAVDWQTGYGSLADIIAGINYVANNTSAKIINMSFSVPASVVGTDDSGALATAIKNAQKKGVVFVASVSNSGKSAIVLPAGDDGVVGVGATDENNNQAAFSDFGTDVDIAAPGVNIVSTFPFAHFAESSGTSFSTAFVSGAAALVRGVSTKDVVCDLEAGAGSISGKIVNLPFGYGALDVKGAGQQASSNKACKVK